MRMMHVVKVMVPWFDTDGMKQWFICNFRGTKSPNRRRVLREIRKLVKRSFGQQVGNEWVKIHCRWVEQQPQTFDEVMFELFAAKMEEAGLEIDSEEPATLQG